jgi:hypothetical protein
MLWTFMKQYGTAVLMFKTFEWFLKIFLFDLVKKLDCDPDPELPVPLKSDPEYRVNLDPNPKKT